MRNQPAPVVHGALFRTRCPAAGDGDLLPKSRTHEKQEIATQQHDPVERAEAQFKGTGGPGGMGVHLKIQPMRQESGRDEQAKADKPQAYPCHPFLMPMRHVRAPLEEALQLRSTA